MPVLGWAVFLHNLLAPTQPPGPILDALRLLWSSCSVSALLGPQDRVERAGLGLSELQVPCPGRGPQ